MKSSITNVSEILNDAEKLISAGFSAGYNFDEVNAAEFFNELVENSTQKSPIFSGILILERDGNVYTVVDGLQRLTTINLLMCAICEHYRDTTASNEQAREKIFKRFLLNEKTPKLQLLSDEQEIYEKILFSLELSKKEKNNNLWLTYNGFLNCLKEQKISGTKFFRILSKIQFMLIITDKTEVSVGDLYQALNKKESAQMNLIKDFVKQIGPNLLWENVLEIYSKQENIELFEDFITDFLTIQNDGLKPKQNALYNKFKSYYSQMLKYQTPVKIIATVCKYAQNYLKIVNSEFEDSELIIEFEKLKKSEGVDAYPYLMEVLDDYESGHIDREVFMNILLTINDFMAKRFANPDKKAIIDFASLSKEINKMLILKDYAQNIEEKGKLTINEINKISDFEV